MGKPSAEILSAEHDRSAVLICRRLLFPNRLDCHSSPFDFLMILVRPAPAREAEAALSHIAVSG